MILQGYIDFRIQNGNLHIVADNVCREEIRQAKADGVNIDSDDYARELLERQLCNGWQEIQPEEVAALTSGLILTDDWSRDDHGKLTEVGRVYWHSQYAVESIGGQLLEKGEIVLQGVE
jgi:hypothetical protein